mgnify:CR=1 FL=1
MAVSDLLYGVYERRLKASLDPERIPRHVGVILDGNRRWAAVQGNSTAQGHRAGADKNLPGAPNPAPTGHRR